jgi:hypothetical protein
MSILISIVRPILVKTMNSCQVKKLVCDLIDKYAGTTDNDVDNFIANMVRNALLKECA